MECSVGGNMYVCIKANRKLRRGMYVCIMHVCVEAKATVWAVRLT